MFIIAARAQSSTRLRDHIFYGIPDSDGFVLKLKESLLKSLRITLKKIVKSILRCRKLLLH